MESSRSLTLHWNLPIALNIHSWNALTQGKLCTLTHNYEYNLQIKITFHEAFIWGIQRFFCFLGGLNKFKLERGSPRFKECVRQDAMTRTWEFLPCSPRSTVHGRTRRLPSGCMWWHCNKGSCIPGRKGKKTKLLTCGPDQQIPVR